MSDVDKEFLDKLAGDVDRELIAQEILDNLLAKCQTGDAESIKLLGDLARQSREDKVRKELFGV